jgi:hypothetical protein
MSRPLRLAYTAAALVLSAPLAADDLTGSQRFVCSAWHAAVCGTEGTCEATEAWRLNLPDFLEVDLRGKVMQTREGSDEPRTTPIQNVAREGNQIILSGHQETRGWSWVVNEGSGEGVLALISDNSSVSLFTVCTATDAS